MPTDEALIAKVLVWMRRHRPEVDWDLQDAEGFIQLFDSELQRLPRDGLDPDTRKEMQHRLLSGQEPIRADSRLNPDLQTVLEAVRVTPPHRQLSLESRDQVAAFGVAAIAPMARWLSDDSLAVFAHAVLYDIAKDGHSAAVLERLAVAYRDASEQGRVNIELIEGPICMMLGRPPAFKKVIPSEVRAWVTSINGTRREQGLPELGVDDVAELVAAHEASQQSPDLYQNHCWNCYAPVTAGMHPRCAACGWLECYCGACTSPMHGYCPRGADRFPDAFSERGSN